MTKLLLALAAGAAATTGLAGLAAPAAAQAASQRVLLIYGNDKCPTDRNGAEIVVCRRLPEADRYRIPEGLRETPMTGANERWASRATDLAATTGKSGPGNCTPSGNGDWAGCWQRDMDTARAERKADKAAAPAAPQP